MPRLELTKHSTGQWKKKIKGKVYYFGTKYGEALERYHRLMAGLRPPAPKPNSIKGTVGQLLEAWYAAKAEQLKQGHLTKTTLDQYVEFLREIELQLGRDRLLSELVPGDFGAMLGEVRKRWQSPSRQ